MIGIRLYLLSRYLRIILIQTIIIVGFSWYYLKESVQKSIDQKFELLLSVTDNINYFYESQIDEMRTITQMDGFNPYQKDKAIELLSNYLKVRSIISSIHLYDKSGNLLFNVQSSQMPNYQADKKYHLHPQKEFVQAFDEVLAQKQMKMTGPLFNNNDSLYHLILLPIFKSVGLKNEMTAILSLSFFPKYNPIEKYFKGLTLSPNNIFMLVGQNGDIVTSVNSNPKHLEVLGKDYMKKRGDLPHNPFQYKHKPQDELIYKVGQKKYYVLSKRVHQLPIFAILGIDESVFNQEKRIVINLIMAIIALSSFVAIVMSFLMSDKILKTFSKIDEAIKNTQKGDYHKQKDDVSIIEVDQLLKNIHDLQSEIKKSKFLGHMWGEKLKYRDEHPHE